MLKLRGFGVKISIEKMSDNQGVNEAKNIKVISRKIKDIFSIIKDIFFLIKDIKIPSFLCAKIEMLIQNGKSDFSTDYFTCAQACYQ